MSGQDEPRVPVVSNSTGVMAGSHDPRTLGIQVHSVTMRAKGASHVFAAATHAILSGKARERIAASPLEEVVVTNTVPPADAAGGKITVLSVASLLGEGIRRIHENTSVSSLFL